jgi:hypothetical protein
VEIAAEFDNIETIKQAVDEDAGVAILPEPTLRREVRRGTLVQARLLLPVGEPPLVRPLSIVHRRKRRLNPAVTEFIRLLRNGTANAPAEPVSRPTAVAVDAAPPADTQTPPPSDDPTAAVVGARGALL